MTVGRTAELDELFRPSSVAVIGASNRPGRVGTSLFRNLLSSGYQGTVYPVNPSWKSVSGVRCYPDLRSLPEVPELGVVIVPAAQVPQTMDELGQAGTKGAIVISAGFREVGEAGAALEAEVVARAQEHSMSLVGPNCFGVFNTDPEIGLNATFSESLPPAGNIAFVSQSGALGAGILKYGAAERIGFSRFVSVGNRAGVDENDLLTSLGRDPRTRVILLYVESLANGRRFLEVAREVTERKPVLVIKSGRTSAGERAARSHTGSLAQSGRDQLYDAVFTQAGVQRVERVGDLFRLAKIFASDIELDGPRLFILTNSGGPGIVAADAAERHGLQLPPLPERTRATLAARLPSIASISNPLDMTADTPAEEYREILQAILESGEVDGALVVSTPAGHLSGERVGVAILEAKAATRKPIVACLFGLSDLSSEVAFLEKRGVPTYTFPEEAVEGLASLARYRAWKARPHEAFRTFPVDRAKAEKVLDLARASGQSALPEYVTRGLLEAYGVRFPPSALTASADEAVAAAARIGYPVVLKVASPEILHKVDVGGVAIGLADAPALRAAWERMDRSVRAAAPGARIDGYEVEAQVSGGKEVLVGFQRDPNFGPVVVFGMGGIYVEALRDVTFRLAPMRPISAQHMIESVRGYSLLRGVRGEPPSDIGAVAETIERVAQLAVERPEILELDVNPLIVRPAGQGVVAVDARAVLAPLSRSAPSP